MAELKKCPFCGGEAELHIGYVSYSVICENCNIEVFCRRTKEETIEAWNKRATESEIRAKAIDEFAEKLKESVDKNFRHFITTDTDGFEWLTTDSVHTHINEVAEQLRGNEE